MKNFIFIFGLSSILFIGCNRKCSDDILLGEKPLSDTSLSFFPYAGTPKLIFKDSNGDIYSFVAQESVNIHEEKIAVYKICSDFKFDGSSSYKYFKGQSKSIYFKMDALDLIFELKLFTQILRPESETFYDKLTLNLNGISTLCDGQIITDVRFSAPYNSEEFKLKNEMILKGQVILNNHTFNEVYTSTNEENILYFTKTRGLVGFKLGDKTYHLDHIE